MIKQNTVSKCKFVKTERKAKDQLTDAEFNKLIKSIDITKFHEYRDYIICNIIMDSGMRLNETLNLTINDVDFTRRTILIPSEINKGRRDRVVYYSQTIIHKLSKILGHSSVTVTEKSYLDLMDEDFRKKYQRFSPLENMNRNNY
ncbi:integrase/recombinase XerD [Clostridium saccharoperbutylacetonicum]|nr:site-specific integrase [Clostridium saccharoperbutylacetonicum]NRT62732.1 integrase/recombinase XerD [Clostridium saccharoperbutylacetonicum]NSB26083.1 integrase/recombinase XerD [Clostridium saccharoperbutylacetonicum]NSB31037.1 integrase/recombinase XerD [Clostridium saccharoperbutylacetonicum]NSB45439.1 integrase/recombinase XerD [Clostridium saccharoperbutylacetonicum]